MSGRGEKGGKGRGACGGCGGGQTPMVPGMDGMGFCKGGGQMDHGRHQSEFPFNAEAMPFSPTSIGQQQQQSQQQHPLQQQMPPMQSQGNPQHPQQQQQPPPQQSAPHGGLSLAMCPAGPMGGKMNYDMGQMEQSGYQNVGWQGHAQHGMDHAGHGQGQNMYSGSGGDLPQGNMRGPGIGPGMGQGMPSGMSPGTGPGMNQGGMGPGMGPGMGSGPGPNRGHGAQNQGPGHGGQNSAHGPGGRGGGMCGGGAMEPHGGVMQLSNQQQQQMQHSQQHPHQQQQQQLQSNATKRHEFTVCNVLDRFYDRAKGESAEEAAMDWAEASGSAYRNVLGDPTAVLAMIIPDGLSSAGGQMNMANPGGGNCGQGGGQSGAQGNNQAAGTGPSPTHHQRGQSGGAGQQMHMMSVQMMQQGYFQQPPMGGQSGQQMVPVFPQQMQMMQGGVGGPPQRSPTSGGGNSGYPHGQGCMPSGPRGKGQQQFNEGSQGGSTAGSMQMAFAGPNSHGYHQDADDMESVSSAGRRQKNWHHGRRNQ